jgi:hypothetical protein
VSFDYLANLKKIGKKKLFFLRDGRGNEERGGYS